MVNKDLAYYLQCFDHLSVNKKGGQQAPHKPLLLLAVIDLVECGIIRSPQIELSKALLTAFKLNDLRYTRHIAHFKPNIGMPYYHMSGEPFWRLVPKVPGNSPSSYAISTLRNFYKCAEIDHELFELMKEPATAQQLRKVLVDTYLANRTDTSLPSLPQVVLLATCLCQLIA